MDLKENDNEGIKGPSALYFQPATWG